MAKPRPTCTETQAWLFHYLSIEIDPYDFSLYLDEFVQEAELTVDPDAGPDGLDPAQLAKFTKWLKQTNKAEEFLRSDPVEAPAYLTLQVESKLPEGSWLIHFTDATDIKSFKQGITIEGLALSRHRPRKVTVDCTKNLSPDNALAEVVFGFAFEADARNVLANSHKYGQHAVLFQSDCALTAFHYGDGETQAIFPLCSEYNLIMLHDVQDGLTVYTDDDEQIDFDTLDEVTTYVEQLEARRTLSGVRFPRLRRLR